MENEINVPTSDNLFGRRRAMKRVKATLRKKGITSKRKLRRAARKATKGRVRAGLKRTAGAILVAPLLPFKGSMKRQLKDKGISTSGMRFPAIVEKFYNEVVKKSESNKDSKYEACPEGKFKDNWVFSYEMNEWETLPDSVVGDIVGSIVKAVISHFKKKKAEKQAIKNAGLNPSTEMTATDLDAANTTEQVVKTLEEKQLDDKNLKAGQMKKIVTYIIIGILVFVVIGIASKKMK